MNLTSYKNFNIPIDPPITRQALLDVVNNWKQWEIRAEDLAVENMRYKQSSNLYKEHEYKNALEVLKSLGHVNPDNNDLYNKCIETLKKYV